MKMRVFEGFHIFWTRSTEINSNIRFMINIFIVLSLSFWHLHFCISRKMLKNAPTLANGGVDTAESRWKFKKSQKSWKMWRIYENSWKSHPKKRSRLPNSSRLCSKFHIKSKKGNEGYEIVFDQLGWLVVLWVKRFMYPSDIGVLCSPRAKIRGSGENWVFL